VNPTYEVNHKIKAGQVRLIGADGSQLGVVDLTYALDQASQADLDLIQINPGTNPPLCKIADFGKFRYELAQAEKDRKKKNRANQVEIKEIQLRPVTDTHDVEIKAKRAVEFLTDGDKVKIVMKFRGRELSHREMGQKIIDAFCAKVGETNYKVDSPLSISGRQMMMIIGPNKK